MTQSKKISIKPVAQPKEIILKLLIASSGEPLTIREAITGCALFGISESHVRVAMVRLSSAGMIEATARGAYQLGPESADFAAEITRWRSGEGRIRPWTGQWIVVHTATLGRRDRAVLRVRERSLTLLGLQELDSGLYVRPDNLADGIAGVRSRLYSLGLEREAPIFIGSGFDMGRDARARHLWDGEALNRVYDRSRQQLETWIKRYAELDLETAARESYLLGDKSIRQLVFDPLLPPPLVDADLRAAFTDTVLRFDQVGHDIWRQLIAHRPPERGADTSVHRSH